MAKKLESLIAAGMMAGIASHRKAHKKKKRKASIEKVKYDQASASDKNASFFLTIFFLVLSIIGFIISYNLFSIGWNFLGVIFSIATIICIGLMVLVNLDVDGGINNLDYSKPYMNGTNSETLMWKQKKAMISIQSKNNNIVNDIDGNVYHTLTIGSQIWMLDNLKTTKYRDGDLIGTTTSATLDISTEINPKYQWSYNGDESNINKYGRLYTWDVIIDSRNVCPIGWHVPCNNEWQLLISELKGTNNIKILKKGSYEINKGQFNNFLTDLLSLVNNGRRSNDGKFEGLGVFGHWWIINENSTDESNAFAIRCIKD